MQKIKTMFIRMDITKDRFFNTCKECVREYYKEEFYKESKKRI